MEETSNEIKKEDIISTIIQILDKKIESAQQGIHSAKESRDNETKSSVGDKYETGRTMMQFELEKQMVQRNKAEAQKQELLKIELHKKSGNVQMGSLVLTDIGHFFISIGLGKIQVKAQNIYCVSPASPAGRLLIGKQKNERISWQEKQINILEIL